MVDQGESPAELAQRIYRDAAANGGVHLLPPLKLADRLHKAAERERELEACARLVASGHARRLARNKGNGIELTAKPFKG